jgi:hypothetical protein
MLLFLSWIPLLYGPKNYVIFAKKMHKHWILPCLFVIAWTGLYAQLSITLQPGPTQGKDCEVFSLQPTTNYVSNLLRGNAWTWSGTPGLERGLFEFDLSTVPNGAIIDSAFLYLYSPNSPNSEFHSGSNSCFLRRITSYWSETSVTWNNQPSTTDINQVILPKSIAPYQDYAHIKVTNLVSDMIQNPGNSFGFMILQQVEQIRRRMTFCSSDYPDDSKHPKLIIFYTPYTPSDCITKILQPGPEGKDCEVFSLQPNTNYVSNLLRGNAWTFSGVTGVERGLFQFDLSFIPPGSEVNSAYLDLYAPNSPSTEFHSGNNESILKRIIVDWNESTLTWNNQPPTTDLNQVVLPKSTGPYQDYVHINVTALVNDMIQNPNKSFGFMIMQQVEQIYRRMSFCSSDYPDSAKRPRLVLCYNTTSCTNLVLQPDASGKDCEVFSLLPNTNYVSDLLRGNAWTFSGKSGIERGLIQFDLSAIPAGSDITSAHLSLYSPNAPSTEYHSGDNGAFLQRIITDWKESTVTWNSQPKTTTVHQVSLPVSSSSYQNYVNIDVTSLVQDMVDYPTASYGFMLRLQLEKIYRRLSFCSGDYSDPKKHPKLEICYDYHPRSTTFENETETTPEISIYPNPCNDWVKVKMNVGFEKSKLQIIDFLGRNILEKEIEPQTQIDMSEFKPSIYLFRILNGNGDVLSLNKVVKQ